MGHIFRELHEIPIPEGAYINHSDARVFIMFDDGGGHKRRQVIGLATSDTTMHPNSMYKFLYPELWKTFYKENSLPEHELHIGMYAALLGIGSQTGLYQILHEIYGPLYGNAIMDYCMYSISNRTDATQLFLEKMADQVKFSDETYDDSWFSSMFLNHMPANANHQFKVQWLRKCVEHGERKAWICIDGSNNDCAISNSNIVEQGKAKSHTSSNIVSFLWAVSAQDGLPLTYFINNGGMTDSKAFQTMILFLKSAGIETEGVILDKGFCNHEVLTMLQELEYPYVVMLKSNTYAHEQMVAGHNEEIRWKVEYVINDRGLFGLTEKKRIFQRHPEEAIVGLFYDGINGSERSVRLIKKILAAKQQAGAAAKEGKKPSVPQKLAPYFEIRQTESKGWSVDYNYQAWQKALDSKGFYSIASSSERSAAEIHRVYCLRDASEKQYMIMKSQLGFDAIRVHKDRSLESKFAVCFIASILRSRIMAVCKKMDMDTNSMIANVNRIVLVLMADGFYKSVNSISAKQLEYLAAFGIRQEYFPLFADEVNRRINNPVNSQIHRLPDDPDSPVAPKKRGRPPKRKEPRGEMRSKRKPGRPKGSKNKKTLAREAVLSGAAQPEKRKPGRPKGSKNKPKQM